MSARSEQHLPLQSGHRSHQRAQLAQQRAPSQSLWNTINQGRHAAVWWTPLTRREEWILLYSFTYS